MRIRHTMNPVVTEDSEGRSVLFGLDATKAEAVLDGFTRQASGITDLDDAEVYDIPFADVDDAYGFFIRCDGNADFNLVINGGAPLQVRRGASGAGGAKFENAKVMMEAQVTDLQVTMVGAGRVSWCIWGNPLA